MGKGSLKCDHSQDEHEPITGRVDVINLTLFFLIALFQIYYVR